LSDDARRGLSQAIIEIMNEKKPETVANLISLVKERGHSKPEILESIMKLQNTHEIRLMRQPASASPELTSQLETESVLALPLWFWLTVALTIVTAIFVFTVPDELYPWVYARYVSGIVFVLCLPGYALIKALFPEPHVEASQRSLDPIERIALSIGLSLAITPIIGLLLNYTPWGIRLTPVTLGLLAFTLTSATLAVAKEHNTRTLAHTD
jgi:small-conductance mechanosensitive channel